MWPNKKPIAYVCFGAALLLCGYWGWSEYKSFHETPQAIPQHAQPATPTGPELSSEIAGLTAKLNALTDSSNQLSSLTNERLDEITQQTLNSLTEYYTAWSRGRAEIQRAMLDSLAQNGRQVNHPLNHEEQIPIRQKAGRAIASQNVEMRKGLKNELKPVSVLVNEIYNNRLDFEQKKQYKMEYQEVENTLKKLKSGNYDLSDLLPVREGIRQFEALLKANIHS